MKKITKGKGIWKKGENRR